MSSSVLGVELLSIAECNASICDEVLAGQPKSVLSMTMEQLSASDDALFLELLGAMTRKRVETREDILAAEPRAIFTYGTLRADWSPTGDKWGVMETLESQGFGLCTWRYGHVHGFSVFQDMSLTYPFAIQRPAGDAVDGEQPPHVFGTVLQWPGDDDAFVEALQRCNNIEGYTGGEGGIYKRMAVPVKIVRGRGSDGGGGGRRRRRGDGDDGSSGGGKADETDEGKAEASAGPLEAEDGEEEEGEEEIMAYIYYQTKQPEDVSQCAAFPEGDWLADRNPPSE